VIKKEVFLSLHHSIDGDSLQIRRVVITDRLQEMNLHFGDRPWGLIVSHFL